VRLLIALRAFLSAMNKKHRDEYRRQKRAEWAARISSLDQDMLELMGRLRRYTYGGELGDKSARGRGKGADAGDRRHGRRHHRRPRIFLWQAAQPGAGPQRAAESAGVIRRLVFVARGSMRRSDLAMAITGLNRPAWHYVL
jgi:hypothetical protein